MNKRFDNLTSSQQELLAVLYISEGETIAFYEQLGQVMKELGHYKKPEETLLKDVSILSAWYLNELPLADPSRHLYCRLTRLNGHGAYAAWEFIKSLDGKKIKRLENAAKNLPKYPSA